jgi:hypothetical protein
MAGQDGANTTVNQVVFTNKQTMMQSIINSNFHLANTMYNQLVYNQPVFTNNAVMPSKNHATVTAVCTVNVKGAMIYITTHIIFCSYGLTLKQNVYIWSTKQDNRFPVTLP